MPSEPAWSAPAAGDEAAHQVRVRADYAVVTDALAMSLRGNLPHGKRAHACNPA